jgi:cyclopropane fatty-acyl-phospholipid synthase-like methyltransferase
MSYRSVLYSNYSESFGENKDFHPEVQFAAYDAIYGRPTLSKDAAVLDIGCGKGEWLAWLKKQGFTQLNGVDASPSDLAIAKTTCGQSNLTLGDGTQHLTSHPNAFDLIHAKDVIEHMTKDEFIAFLQAAHAALKPGGQLWLLSFNAQAPLAGATRYGDFTHESGHTPSSLAQCLRACGYHDPSVHGVHYCSRSLSGRVRALTSWPVQKIGRMVLRLRHGGGGSIGRVDYLCAQPDLFAIGRKL